MEDMKETLNIITCGVRWGNGSPSFVSLSLENNVAILGVGNKNIETFRSANENTLIALKDGHSIIALGRFKKRDSVFTWEKAITDYMSTGESSGTKYNTEAQQKLSDDFWFELIEQVDIVEVEGWVILDPPIYYPVRMSTVSIRDKSTFKECLHRFDQGQLEIVEYNKTQITYNSQMANGFINEYRLLINNGENFDKEKSIELLTQSKAHIEKALTYDENNKDTLLLITVLEHEIKTNSKDPKPPIEKIQTSSQTKRKELSGIYSDKTKALKEKNYFYITLFFLFIIAIGISFYAIMSDDFSDVNFTIYSFLIRSMASITLTMVTFWGARFLNRRIHENVHLSEEYEYRALLLDMFETLKANVEDKDQQKEILNKITISLTENPTYALHRKKADKIPTELIELAKILNPK